MVKKPSGFGPGDCRLGALIVDRYFCPVLCGILFLALVLRVGALLSLKQSIYFDFLVLDEKVYHIWASRIADGTFASSSVYEMAPLFAYVVALIYKTFGPDPLYVRIANIGFGVLTCYGIFLIGNALANRAIGLVACLVACVCKPLIFYSIVPLKASLSVLLFAAAIYLFAEILKDVSKKKRFFSWVCAWAYAQCPAPVPCLHPFHAGCDPLGWL